MIKIEVEVPYDLVVNDRAAQYLDRALGAIGFVRADKLISSTAPVNYPITGDIGADLASETLDADTINEFAASVVDAYTTKPTRQRGQPSPGAKRRTKAEIAEDDAAAVANVASIKADVLAGADEQQKVYDSPEAQAQDAADEAAEAEAHKTGLTHDDLRQAVGRYQKKFGMAAAVAGVPALLGCALIDVPEADLAAAIAKVDAAVAGEAPSADQEKVVEVEKAATKEDVMAAMLRYAEKFDGQSKDMNAMPKTMEDAPKIFTLLFGKDVVKLSQVPADGYAKTVAAFNEAITKNPFKR